MPAPRRPCCGVLPGSVDAESPLLLDPSDPGIDPFEHLRWSVEDPDLAPRLWTWRLDPLTPEGQATRKILHLHELEDEINNRYKETTWPRFRQVRDTLVHGEHARARWDKLEPLVQPEASFAAATWWQLDALRDWANSEFASSLPPLPRPGAAPQR